MTSDKTTKKSPAVSRRERRAAERAARRSGGIARTGGGTARTATRRAAPSLGVLSGAVVVVGIIAVLGFFALSGGLGDDDLEAVTLPEDPPPAAALQDGRSLGDPDAPVRIEVYEDPQCPACGVYSRQIEPLLIAGPVAAGEVRYTYHDLAFLGQESLDAASAMRVAEELDGKFWEFHHVLFHNQQGENDGAFSRERLADMAELVGLDRQAFLAELDEPEYVEAVEAQSAEAQEQGISSTPTLIVDGEIISGVPSWEDLDARIEAAAGVSRDEAA